MCSLNASDWVTDTPGSAKSNPFQSSSSCKHRKQSLRRERLTVSEQPPGHRVLGLSGSRSGSKDWGPCWPLADPQRRIVCSGFENKARCSQLERNVMFSSSVSLEVWTWCRTSCSHSLKAGGHDVERGPTCHLQSSSELSGSCFYQRSLEPHPTVQNQLI